MKLMLRPEWRLWPLSSFFGVLDIKTGVTVALLFALLNKVAGVYGLIAVLTGAGGSFAQLSLYIYSVIALVALAWGLRVVQEEDPKKTLYFAHLFFADHIFSTSWTVFFAVGWWLWNPHDGQRQANSVAQQKMMELGNSSATHLTDEERKEAALAIWNHEKGLAAFVIIISWIFKIYFALLIYSYAMHLRKGSYRSLPLSRNAYASSNVASHAAYDALAEEDEEIEDFYRVPLRTPPVSGHRRGSSNNNNSSIASFADFVSAPGRTPRKKTFGSISMGKDRGIEEETLFDEDELTYAGSSSSRAHSKLGTESSTTAASDEERAINGFASDNGKGKFIRND